MLLFLLSAANIVLTAVLLFLRISTNTQDLASLTTAVFNTITTQYIAAGIVLQNLVS